MCTVSWLPDPLGYTLCFNRDERFTRAPALPPTARESAGVRYIAPTDGNFGGTWLATNEFGLTLGILNRYGVAAPRALAAPRSRGLLPVELIVHATAADALAALRVRDLDMVQPFVLVATEPGGPARLAAWDGRVLDISLHDAAGLILTSSSVTEPEVAASRQALFNALPMVTAEALVALHRSHLPDRGRRSICMHRDDAETQSFSEVRVIPDQVAFVHVPDAPCRGSALPAVILARRHLHSPLPS